MSVIAFILVLGIVVDDAIVVGERIYAHERHAENQLSAAVEGTSEVAVPVIFGVLTTMAAFIPVIFLPGRIGSFFSVMGYIVVICLIFSIIESQLILPSHLAHRRIEPRGGRTNPFVRRWLNFQEKLSSGIENFATVDALTGSSSNFPNGSSRFWILLTKEVLAPFSSNRRTR